MKTRDPVQSPCLDRHEVSKRKAKRQTLTGRKSITATQILSEALVGCGGKKTDAPRKKGGKVTAHKGWAMDQVTRISGACNRTKRKEERSWVGGNKKQKKK